MPMLPLFLLAALALAQTTSEEPKLFEFGQLRHVQLLEPRGEVTRFATQIEIGTIDEDLWSEGKDTCVAVFEGDAAEPVAEMAVGRSLIPYFTWTTRPAWFLMELEETTVLAVLEFPNSWEWRESDENSLRLCSFPQGDEILSVPGVHGIEDGLVRSGRADLLVRRGGNVLWLRLSRAGEVIDVTTIDPGLDVIGCATFVRGAAGESLGAWAVGWRKSDLFAVPLDDRQAALERAFRVTFDGGPRPDVLRVGDAVRAAAWEQSSHSHLAVSWPGYEFGVGKLQVIDVSAESRAHWEGRPYPEANGDSSDQRDYGQAIAFIPDGNDDHVPEILVTGPWADAGTSIDVLSGASGELMKRWVSGFLPSTGHSLSLSADAGHVLVGGAEQRGYPERLSYEGQAHLLDVATMRPIQTWRLRARER